MSKAKHIATIVDSSGSITNNTLTTSLGLKAPLASPTLTGTPLTPTAAIGTNTTQIASTAYVRSAIADLVASAPSSLDTLNELATALGNDVNFSTTVTNSLALKAPLASPSFTGNVGIGTSSPSSYGRLAVMTPTATYGYLGINNSSGGGGGLQLSTFYATTKISYIDTILQNGTPGSETAAIAFATTATGSLAERMRIDSSGNVGIGTSSPQAKLHLGAGWFGIQSDVSTDTAVPAWQTARINGEIHANSGVGSGSDGGLLRLSAGGETSASGGQKAGIDMSGYNTTDNGPTLRFYTGAERMRINSLGNVGIGTSSPVNRLTVASNTHNDIYGLIQAYNLGTGSLDNASVTVKTYNGTSQFMQWENIGLRIGSRIKTNSGAGNVVFTYGNDTEGMRIDGNGDLNVSGRIFGTLATIGAGNVNYSTGRNTHRQGLSHFGGYNTGTGRPYNYDYALQVTDGSRGFELSANWLGGNNMSIRTLRDCCTDWSGWTEFAFVAGSDRRKKTNIEYISQDRIKSIILSLDAVEYDPVNEDGTLGRPKDENPDLREECTKEFGYIAQDAIVIVPEVVKFNPLNDTPNDVGWANAYSVDYQRLVPILTEAMKGLYVEIDNLKLEIERIKNGT